MNWPRIIVRGTVYTLCALAFICVCYLGYYYTPEDQAIDARQVLPLTYHEIETQHLRDTKPPCCFYDCFCP